MTLGSILFLPCLISMHIKHLIDPYIRNLEVKDCKKFDANFELKPSFGGRVICMCGARGGQTITKSILSLIIEHNLVCLVLWCIVLFKSVFHMKMHQNNLFFLFCFSFLTSTYQNHRKTL